MTNMSITVAISNVSYYTGLSTKLFATQITGIDSWSSNPIIFDFSSIPSSFGSFNLPSNAINISSISSGAVTFTANFTAASSQTFYIVPSTYDGYSMCSYPFSVNTQLQSPNSNSSRFASSSKNTSTTLVIIVSSSVGGLFYILSVLGFVIFRSFRRSRFTKHVPLMASCPGSQIDLRERSIQLINLTFTSEIGSILQRFYINLSAVSANYSIFNV